MPDMFRAANKIAAAMHDAIRVDDHHKIIERSDREGLRIPRPFCCALQHKIRLRKPCGDAPRCLWCNRLHLGEFQGFAPVGRPEDRWVSIRSNRRNESMAGVHPTTEAMSRKIRPGNLSFVG